MVQLPRLLDWVHFPLRPQRLDPGANDLGRRPFRRRLPLSFGSRRRRFHQLAQASAEWIGPSNGLAVRLCWLYSLLRRGRPQRHETLAAEANPTNHLSPQRYWPLLCLVCAFSLSIGP